MTERILPKRHMLIQTPAFDDLGTRVFWNQSDRQRFHHSKDVLLRKSIAVEGTKFFESFCLIKISSHCKQKGAALDRLPAKTIVPKLFTSAIHRSEKCL